MKTVRVLLYRFLGGGAVARQHLLPFLLMCCVVSHAQIHKMTRNDSTDISRSYNLKAPGYQYVLELSQYELDFWNQKFHFLYSDNGMVFHTGSPTHVVFHPVFHELVEKYLETGKIEFS